MNQIPAFKKFLLCPCVRQCFLPLELGAACAVGERRAIELPNTSRLLQSMQMPPWERRFFTSSPAGDARGVAGGAGDPRPAHVDLMAVGLSSTRLLDLALLLYLSIYPWF